MIRVQLRAIKILTETNQKTDPNGKKTKHAAAHKVQVKIDSYQVIKDPDH